MIRQTKIVATLGPATADDSTLRALIDAGMDVARLNFSYGSHDDHARMLAALDQAQAGGGGQVAVLQDLPGPKLRTGRLPGGGLDLRQGETVVLSSDPHAGDHIIPHHYPGLAQDVRPGDQIFLQDGEIALRVLGIEESRISAIVQHGGHLRQHAGINLPGVRLSAPAVTEEDFHHLAFGLDHHVDYVALSFVEGPEEITRVREHLAGRTSAPRLIAKIERRKAVERIDEIIEAADAVMIARGDLAVEVSPEEVPIIQKRLIAACNLRGRPVITATQMLESMIERPRPTRAEAADVANAVLDGTDALMLSGETAIGKFTTETVATMARIAARAEDALPYDAIRRERAASLTRDTAEAIALAAVQAAETLDAAAIVAATGSGSTALRVARFRPRQPIVAVTPSHETARRLRLAWGVHPVVMDAFDDLDRLVDAAADAARVAKMARPGDRVVVTAGYPLGRPGTTNFLKVVRIHS